MNVKNILGDIPPVVKNLLIINALMLFATFIAEEQFGIGLTKILGLYYFGSEQFNPYQIVTHIFMHGGLFHLIFNMFALWMFGKVLETVWGSKRFFIYYMVTGLGAALLHNLVNFIEVQILLPKMTPDQIQMVFTEGFSVIKQSKNYVEPLSGKLNYLINIPTVGASGAVFGVLLAFGMLFPNTELMLMFPPIPIKAKYFVIGYGLIELFSGIRNSPGDNIAHFAHLGGMIFGFILLKFVWKDIKKFN